MQQMAGDGKTVTPSLPQPDLWTGMALANVNGGFEVEAGHGIATQPLSHNDFPVVVDAVNLEDILRQIQTYPNDLHDILLHRS
ncbi:hypothetical protein I6F15_29880 [Bradyrhizobium sp. BRP14]|nr:hypothetical protein [Bradyrhizobium sp. BRP14]